MKQSPLSRRMERIDSSEIRRVFALAASLKNPINLSIGQPHYPTPPEIVEAMCRAAREGHTSYTQTQGILPLREALAEKFQTENGFGADPADILVSPGVAALIDLFLQSSIDPGDEVLISDPCFLIYRSMLSYLGAKVASFPENFSGDELLEHKNKKYKFIIYCSPSNPSGYVMKKEQIQKLGDLADATGAILVADEIYERFDYEGRFRSAASVYPRSLVFAGFSKAWNMTGLRLGAVGTPKGIPEARSIIEAMTTLQQYSYVCAPAPVQWAGITALKTDVSAHVEAYRKNRDRCVETLRGSYNIDIEPGGAFYLFPELKGTEDDRSFVERAIQEKELLLVPGRIFTESHKRIRISYAATPETLERGLAALLELARG